MTREGDTITVSANVEVWRAVLDTLRRSLVADPFYQALVLEVESALEDWLDEVLKRDRMSVGEDNRDRARTRPTRRSQTPRSLGNTIGYVARTKPVRSIGRNPRPYCAECGHFQGKCICSESQRPVQD